MGYEKTKPPRFASQASIRQNHYLASRHTSPALKLCEQTCAWTEDSSATSPCSDTSGMTSSSDDEAQVERIYGVITRRPSRALQPALQTLFAITSGTRVRLRVQSGCP